LNPALFHENLDGGCFRTFSFYSHICLAVPLIYESQRYFIEI